MRKSVFIALLFISKMMFSQNGYQLEINFTNVNEQKLYLSYYGGSLSKTHVVDSATLSGKNKVVFTQKKKIINAVYRLSFAKNEKVNYVNIDLENNSNLVFTLDNTLLRAMKTKDPLNEALLLSQSVVNREERKKYLEVIPKKFPTSAAALYAKFELKELSVPSGENELKIYRDHYFTDVDLNDKRIKFLPNIYSSLFNYVKLLPLNNDNYKASIDNLLRNQNCKSLNYLFYIKWIYMNREYLSKYNLGDSYHYVFNTYHNSVECMKADEKLYQSAAMKLREIEKLPVGSAIPDLKLMEINDADLNLSSVFAQHDYTLLVFYDPSCSHCQEKMPEIQKFFSENKFSKDVKVVAFLNVDSDKEWKKFVEDYHMQNWLNVKSKGSDMKYQTDLGVFGNPNFLLLDKQGKVVLKNYNTDEFKMLFK